MTTQKDGFKEVTLRIPNDFKVMDDFEFIKLRELIKAGLEIVDTIGEIGQLDKTATILWPVLRFASDLLDKYPETIDILGEVANHNAINPKKRRPPAVDTCS